MKIELTETETLDILDGALCNGMQELYCYGIEIAQNLSYRDKWEDARQRLKKDDPEIALCREDIWVEILRAGQSIVFMDEDYDVHELTLKDAKERLEKSEEVRKHVMDMLNENDDAITADCILQTALFGKIIYG